MLPNTESNLTVTPLAFASVAPAAENNAIRTLRRRQGV